VSWQARATQVLPHGASTYALPLLVRMAASEDPDVAEAAADSLREFGSPERPLAVPAALVERLSGSPPSAPAGRDGAGRPAPPDPRRLTGFSLCGGRVSLLGRASGGEDPVLMTTTSETPGLVRRHPVLFGFVLMFVCTWPIDLWAAAGSHGLVSVTIPPFLPVLVGYGFVVAAIVMTAVLDGRAGVVALLRRFLIWRFGVLWWAVILVGPVAVDLIGIGIDVLLHGTVPAFDQPFILRIVGPSVGLTLALPLFVAMEVLTNGEEIGWRGFALPRLQARHSALVSSLVIGVVWAVWHYPKFLTAGNAHDYPFWLFVLDIVAKSIIFTCVFNSTRGSLLSVTLLHASINTSTVFLPVLPAVTGDNKVLVTTMVLHIAIAVAIVLVAGPARLTRSRHQVLTP
jgi:uncharacterized protein